MNIIYVTPLLRGEWLFGIWWNRADGHWDTVHRVRCGFGPFVWELHWWMKKVRDEDTRRRKLGLPA